MSLFAWKPINIVRWALNRCLEQFARLQMALAGDESTQHQTQRSLHVSDLASPQTISRHHRLEPLPQKQAPAEERKKTRRKKTRRKRQEEVGEQRRGDVDGQEGVSGGGGEDPLLEASTLQQMQARLDPLYSGTNSPLNVEPQSTAALSSDSESTPVRGPVEGEGEGEVTLREDGGETGHRKRRKRRRREGGSSTRDQQELSEEQERLDPPVADIAAQPHPPPQGASRAARPAPQYFPPPEEIQGEGEEGGEMVMAGASPDLVSRHPKQSPDLLYVERADGRGFEVRRKKTSVTPTDDDTQCLGATDRPLSSELTALYSHQFVQKVSFAAYGLLAGLSLWDCVVSNVMGSLPGRHLTLLQSYHLISLPAHSLYLLLLSLASLSLLDRLDLARVGRQCWQFSLCTLPGLALLTATVLTGAALLVSLSLAATDDRVSLYPDQPSLWPDIVTPHNLTTTNSTPPTLTTHTVSGDLVYIPKSVDPMTSSLSVWLGLSVFRSICCVLGWGLLVLVSAHDRMKEYVSDMLESSVKQRQQFRGPSGAPTPHRDPQNPPQLEPTTTTATETSRPAPV